MSIPKRTIGSYERGENPPNEKFILGLVEKLNIDANWFLTGNGSMKRQTKENKELIESLDANHIRIIEEILNTELGYKTLLTLTKIKEHKESEIDNLIGCLKEINKNI